MLTGILAGFLAAFLQSGSYVCSRGFLAKYRSSAWLSVYSQIGMGILGGITLLFVPVGHTFDDFPVFAGTILFWAFSMLLGQYAFFRSLREIEASRLASLLGMKILILAVISVLFLQGRLSLLQCLAVCISAAAAMAMNWSGGRHISGKGCAWLFLTLLFYSLADLAEARMVLMVRTGGIILDGIIIGAISYFFFGLVTLPGLIWVPRRWKLLLHAFPFGAAWYYAMTVLFICFGTLGAVFGNVVQASRGLFSILFGIVLAGFGMSRMEERISPWAWCRRVLAALLMMMAIYLYSRGGAAEIPR